MSRSSTATVRARPVPKTSSVSGAFRVHGETFVVPTSDRLQILDITDRVLQLVAAEGIAEGLVNVCSLHTTCALFVNEFQPALERDMRVFLERLVDGNDVWIHNDPNYSDCDRANADSHLRTLLLGHSLTLQVNGGEVVLGQWQRMLMAELDGPRPRTLRVQVMGVGSTGNLESGS